MWPLPASAHSSVTAARRGGPPSGHGTRACLREPGCGACAPCAGRVPSPLWANAGPLPWVERHIRLLGKDRSFLRHLPASGGDALEQWEVLDGPVFLGIEEHGRRRAGPWALRSVHPECCPSTLPPSAPGHKATSPGPHPRPPAEVHPAGADPTPPPRPPAAPRLMARAGSLLKPGVVPALADGGLHPPLAGTAPLHAPTCKRVPEKPHVRVLDSRTHGPPAPAGCMTTRRVGPKGHRQALEPQGAQHKPRPGMEQATQDHTDLIPEVSPQRATHRALPLQPRRQPAAPTGRATAQRAGATARVASCSSKSPTETTCACPPVL